MFSSVKSVALTPLFSYLEEISNVQMSPLKALVGKNVFRKESGVTIAKIANYPSAVEGYAPEVVKAEREIFSIKKAEKLRLNGN